MVVIVVMFEGQLTTRETLEARYACNPQFP